MEGGDRLARKALLSWLCLSRGKEVRLLCDEKLTEQPSLRLGWHPALHGGWANGQLLLWPSNVERAMEIRPIGKLYREGQKHVLCKLNLFISLSTFPCLYFIFLMVLLTYVWIYQTLSSTKKNQWRHFWSNLEMELKVERAPVRNSM